MVVLRKSKEELQNAFPGAVGKVSAAPRCSQVQPYGAEWSPRGVQHGFPLAAGRPGTTNPNTHNPQGRWGSSRM